MKEGKIEAAENPGFMAEAQEKEKRRLGKEPTSTSIPVGEGRDRF